MENMTKRVGLAGLVGAVVLTAFSTAHAAVDDETVFVFNTVNFMIHGFLVMWMAAGFCMLETGMVRMRSAATISLKNISLYSIAGLMYWIVGYNLMYPGDFNGYFGFAGPFWGADDSAALAGDFAAVGYSAASDWFFQMVFCATAASIVSGTLAERIKVWPFLIFVAVLTGVLYPITGSWQWGGGWLAEAGFSDFAGSTLVHSVGGWAALTGAIVLGARSGRYNPDGSTNPMPGSMLPLATLGTFILWLGWFGFNGGSQLAMGSAVDVIDISTIYMNTNLAAASGVVVAMFLSQILYKKIDLSITLNGAIGGLVAITAEPLAPAVWQAVVVGGVGGLIIAITVPMLDKLRIDDVVGAIPAHLFCGIWGTIIVPFSNGDISYVTQAVGIASIGAFTVVASLVVWLLLKFTIGIRASAEEEERGLDIVELGIEAYPEFKK